MTKGERERRQHVDRQTLVQVAERALSLLSFVEDLAWDHSVDAAGDLVEAVAALERALAKLAGRSG